MRDLIPIMTMIDEFSQIFEFDMIKPTIKCKLFEDNNGALELAKASKMRPRT